MYGRFTNMYHQVCRPKVSANIPVPWSIRVEFTNHPDVCFQKGDPKRDRMENRSKHHNATVHLWDHAGFASPGRCLGITTVPNKEWLTWEVHVTRFPNPCSMVKWLGPQDSLKKKSTSPKNTKSQHTCAKVKWIRTKLTNIFHKLGPFLQL